MIWNGYIFFVAVHQSGSEFISKFPLAWEQTTQESIIKVNHFMIQLILLP